MYIGDEAGIREVPEPIAFIERVFVSFAPTRTPISLPFMTNRGPIFMEPMFIPGIGSFGADEGLVAGLAAGIGIFIWLAGDGEAAAGICIPGMLSVFGVGDGDAFDAGDGVGITC